jgi:hypothetical protein
MSVGMGILLLGTGRKRRGIRATIRSGADGRLQSRR